MVYSVWIAYICNVKKILMARYNVDKLLTEHTSDVTIGGGGNALHD